MPIADSSPPIVVGIRQTSSETSTNTRLRRAGVDRERLQRDDREQEDDRQAGEQDVQRDLVRRLLPLGALDERDHAIEERVTGIRRDADLDPVRQHSRAAGDGRPIAAGLADDRRRFAGDRRLVHRRDAFDDLAVGRDELAGLDHDHVALAQGGCRDDVGEACRRQPVGNGFGPRPAQRVGLRLAAPFGHRFGEVREQHRQPEPERDLEFEAEAAAAGHRVPHERQRRQHAADLDDEHDRVLRHRARMQLDERIERRAADDLRVPDGPCLLLLARHVRTPCPGASADARRWDRD